MSFPKASASPAAEKIDVAPSRAGRKAITFYVEPEVWAAARVLAIRQERTTQDMLHELLTRYLKDQGAA